MSDRKSAQHAVLQQRAQEASSLISRLLLAGSTPEEIGERTQVSARTVYRWWREGHAPHPVMLEAVRRFAAERGIQ
jgi:DNA invertase Pin-like site-specific DNA recombinase